MLGTLQDGLQEMTADISKLVNLRHLVLTHGKLEYIPESISCLQKLTALYISNSLLSEVPAGLGMLGSLASLQIVWNDTNSFLRFPTKLEVSAPICSAYSQRQ